MCVNFFKNYFMIAVIFTNIKIQKLSFLLICIKYKAYSCITLINKST